VKTAISGRVDEIVCISIIHCNLVNALKIGHLVAVIVARVDGLQPTISGDSEEARSIGGNTENIIILVNKAFTFTPHG